MGGSSIVLALDEILFGVLPLDSLLEPGLEPVLDILDAVLHVLVELIFTALVVLPDGKTLLAGLLVL